MATLLATYAAATASLADGSDGSYLTATQTNGTPDTIIDDSPASLGTALSGTAGTSAISHIVIRVRARQAVSGGGLVSNDMIHWELGAFMNESAIALGSSFANYQTGEIATKPGGGPWTWDDLDDLAAVGIAASFYLIPAAVCSIFLAEVAVDVYGTTGIEGDLLSGDLAGTLHADDMEGDLLSGNLGGTLTSADLTGDLQSGDIHGELEVGP